MQRRRFLAYLAAEGCLGTLACTLSGCGTLLHHDRVGQPHSQQIDWKIAALNGLGMLFFFVPGVAAFAVDFYTGAIYLPSDEYYPPSYPPSEPVVVPPRMVPENLPSPPPGAAGVPGPSLQPAAPPTAGAQLPPAEAQLPPPPLGLRRVVVPRDQLQPQVLEQVVSRHVGQPVSLEHEQARLSILPKLEQFQEQKTRHASDRRFGYAVRSFFQRFQQA